MTQFMYFPILINQKCYIIRTKYHYIVTFLKAFFLLNIYYVMVIQNVFRFSYNNFYPILCGGWWCYGCYFFSGEGRGNGGFFISFVVNLNLNIKLKRF